MLKNSKDHLYNKIIEKYISMSTHNPNARLEAFSDGVFAIAATLLIIEIKVPAEHLIHSKEDLLKAFIHQWASWLAFLISFITILISWVNHNHATKLIDKTSPKFTYANGLLLLSIAILPFPTAAVGEYIHTDYAQPAISFYCMISLLNNFSWLVIIKTAMPLYKTSVDMDKIRTSNKYVLYGFFLYVFAFAISFWFPLTAFGIIAGSFVLWLILGVSMNEYEIEE
ncbi:MAG: TMEM175 family protein [Bacteroidota bacterium]|nr:TMEM175 family protein [Bacteroidota bacterium]